MLRVYGVRYKENSIMYIDPGDLPILIMYGDEDCDVIINQSELFYNALTKAGVKTEFVRVKNVGNGFAPVPEGAANSVGKEELDEIVWNWFKEIFAAKK